MSESWNIFMEMRERIDHVMLRDLCKYIGTMTAAYDQAFKNVNGLLKDVQAEIIESQARENALMVGTLSILTGAVAGALADGLVKRLPAVEKAAGAQAIAAVAKQAEEDPVLYKVFKDTTKNLVKKGVDQAQELGLDRFKAEPPSDGFQPVGMTVESYRAKLQDGLSDRGEFLWQFADLLLNSADHWTAEAAGMLRDGLYSTDFFKTKAPLHSDILTKKAELALWSAWALVRDEDYWTTQVALKYAPGASEVWHWARLQSRLVELDVPEDLITIYPMLYIPGKTTKGLDMVGFKKWARGGGMVHTLFDGIPVDGGAHHRATARMLQVFGLANSWS
jgi:hypothetical protein